MGSHTADELTKQGFDVTIFDCVASPWLNESQQMVIGDVLNAELLSKTFHGAQYIYHFAGVADIGKQVMPRRKINVRDKYRQIDLDTCQR